MPQEQGPADFHCDALIVGAGAAGLTTALVAHDLGLQVLVVEKAAQFGGTMARSGGWLWVPGTRLATDAGVAGSLAEARRYIEHEAGAHFDAPRVDAFLQAAGLMVDFLESRSQVRFVFGHQYPDYHPDHPGGVEQGRSIHTEPYDGAKLGALLHKLAPQMRESTFLGMGLNSGPDLKHFLNVTRSFTSARFVTARLLSHFWSLVRYGRGTRLVNGNALAARLLASINDRKINAWEESAVVDLLTDRGRVTGAVIRRGGKAAKVHARCGVVLAAGGFPQDVDFHPEVIH